MSKESVIVVVRNDEKDAVLLVKRRDIPVWVLPGGAIDPGEESHMSALRELQEETGYEGAIVRKVGTYHPANRLTNTTHLYECCIVSGKATITDETQGVRFFHIKKLPALLAPPHDLWIQDTLLEAKEPLSKRLDCITYRLLFQSALKHPILVLRFLLARLGLPINS